MKKSLTIFLQIVVVLITLGALVFMLWEPHLEGRNVNATFFQTYFRDPFLAYAYASSILFFIGSYKLFKLLGYIRENRALSVNSLKALRTMKYCATTLVVLIALPVAYLFIARPGDDIAGGVATGLFLVIVFGTVATLSKVYEGRLKKVIGTVSSQVN